MKKRERDANESDAVYGNQWVDFLKAPLRLPSAQLAQSQSDGNFTSGLTDMTAEPNYFFLMKDHSISDRSSEMKSAKPFWVLYRVIRSSKFSLFGRLLTFSIF
jgi:hypothetical protein